MGLHDIPFEEIYDQYDTHNPNETLWDGIFPEEDVYQIEKFFDD